MNGCRRPQRERQPSDTEPIRGSVIASMAVAIINAIAHNEPERPSTWLK